jgi:hypothetical protein
VVKKLVGGGIKPLCINVAEFANYTCSTHQTIKYVHVNIEKALYHIYSMLSLAEVPKCDVYKTSGDTNKYVHVNIDNASSFKSGNIKT